MIACLIVQGLEVLDEATSMLTSSLQDSPGAIPEMAKVFHTLVLAKSTLGTCERKQSF